jgi:hypothetical protein
MYLILSSAVTLFENYTKTILKNFTKNKQYTALDISHSTLASGAIAVFTYKKSPQT